MTRSRPAVSFIAAVFLIAPAGWWSETCFAEESLPLPELRAEVKEEREQELLYLKEEIVSIAVRHEQPISQAPSNVYVITDEDIRQSGAPDLPTVLRRIPGMEVMQVTGADFNVSVHGDNQLQANKLLVMVDGRSILLDIQSTVHWKLVPITLPEIKRIEVLKGPASAVYGFNAFDGIINIITKSPEEIKGTTFQFGGGEFGTISSAAIQAGTVGNFGYRLSGGWDQNQQWRNRDSLAFRAYKFNLHTDYTLSNNSKLALSGGLVDSSRYEGPLTPTSLPHLNPTQAYANLTYERPGFYARGWWFGHRSTDQLITQPPLSGFLQPADRTLRPVSEVTADSYNLEAQQALEVGRTHRLTFGINFRHNALSSNLLPKYGQEDRLGFYLQDEWSTLARLRVIGSIRYDLDTFINPTTSPRLSVLFNPTTEHTFRATVSVAYRPPTLIETFLDFRSVTTLPPPFPSPPPQPITGSPNLDPEQIVSYEAGYQGWFVGHRLRVRADIFFKHLSNILNFRGLGTISNGAEGDIYGGDAGVDFLAARWLSGFANFSYQEIGQTFTSSDLRGAPRFKYNAGLRGQWENGLSGEIAYHYVGAATYPISPAFAAFSAFGVVPPDPHVGSYNLLNLRGAYRFWQQEVAAGYRREAEVAVSVFNALNDKHKEHPLGDVIGSRVMGGLTVRY